MRVGVWIVLLGGLLLVPAGTARQAASPYDGDWHGAFDGTLSAAGHSGPAHVEFDFTVSSSQISGEMSGSINSTGFAPGVQGDWSIYHCSGDMRFFPSGSAQSVGTVKCEGLGTATGSVTATRTGGAPSGGQGASGGSGGDQGTVGGGGGSGLDPARAAFNISRIVGEATLWHADGSSFPLAGSVPLRQGDTITTGDHRVRVTFADGSVIVLDRHTTWTLSVDSYYHFGIATDQDHGNIWYHLAPRKRRVYSPNGIIAVRGTTFTVEVLGRITRVRVYQGSVVVNTAGGFYPQLVKRGFESRIGNSSSTPKRFIPPADPFWGSVP